MSNEPDKFTEQELEALAREVGKPVREGFIKDVFDKIHAPKKDRKQELEDLMKDKESDSPEREMQSNTARRLHFA